MVSVVLPLLFAAKPQVTAWVVGYNPTSIQRFEERASQLDAVFTEYYTVNKEGKLERRKQYDKTFAKAREIAKKHRVQFYAMINNYGVDDGVEIGFEPTRVTKFLATNETREAFANDLVKFLKEDQAIGVDLDLESLNADDKDRYSAFVAALSKAAHKEGLKVSVTVHPKETVDGNWDGVKAHDYKALGATIDRFNVMTYDFSWSTSPAGPIAPNDWVERVIKFAKSQMDASKIGMGIPCYGYDWSKKPTGSLSWKDFEGRKYTVDERSGEYVDGQIHFSGGNAFRAKYDLATKLGIGSVAFWYCGSEEPAVWKFLPIRQ